jgi:hypothetical protein
MSRGEAIEAGRITTGEPTTHLVGATVNLLPMPAWTPGSASGLPALANSQMAANNPPVAGPSSVH